MDELTISQRTWAAKHILKPQFNQVEVSLSQ
jgi:hypothetical protein